MCGGGYFSLYSAAQAQELKQLGQARDSQPAILVPVVSLSLSLPSLSLTGPPAQLVLAFVTPTVGYSCRVLLYFLLNLNDLRVIKMAPDIRRFPLFLFFSYTPCTLYCSYPLYFSFPFFLS